MSRNAQEEAFERLLTTSLARVIDFVRFAEAKNAALLTFSSAWLLGLANIISRGEHYPASLVATAKVAIVFFLAAVLVSFSSLLPSRRLGLRAEKPRPKSLTYFGDIASFEPAAYRRILLDTYMPDEGRSATTAYFDDLAMQIAVNSAIANRKFSQFAAGGSLVLCGVAVIFSYACWQGLMQFVGRGAW